MPLFEPADKEALKLLSGMPRNQPGPSASGSSSSRAVATPIVPGHALGYNNSQATSRPAVSSPWGNRAVYKDNLHASRGGNWQPNTSTLTNQYKKRKTQHYDSHIGDIATPRSRPRHSVPNGSSSRHPVSSSTDMQRESLREFHEVYNVDEDVGEVISSDDPLLLKSLPSPPAAPGWRPRHAAQSPHLATPFKRGDIPIVVDSPYGSRAEASFPSGVSDYAPRKRRSSSTEMEIPLAEDGPSVSRLRRDTPCPPREPSPLDSIKSFTPEPVPAPSLQSGPPHSMHSSPGRKAIPNLIVPLRMAAYTNNDTSVVQPVPHVDLTNPPKLKRKLIAKSMQASQKQPKDAIATASTVYTASKPKTPATKPEGVIELPIQQGYVGTQRIGDTPKRMLSYTKSKKTISLFEKSNAARGPETHELSLRVDLDVDLLQTCDDDEAYMFKFKFKECPRSVKIHNEQFRSFCNDDHEDAYMLLLRFDSDRASAHSFATLSTILRNVTQGECQKLQRHGAKAVWEAHEVTSKRVAPLLHPSGPARLVKIPGIYTTPESGGARTSGDEPLPRMQGARRSARISYANESPVEEPGPSNLVPQPADDELILIHPPTGTGAFHITRGDRRRLGPSEFLNDTLIEFGLKLWMDDLRSTSPELADQIYVFNSFFYNKLTSVPRKVEEGYLNVRKWTSKIDLFKKKYIIVPINENLHWYLAIICDPEHVLQLPLPKKVAPLSVLTRHQRRKDETSIDFDSPVAAGEDLSAPSAATDDADGQEVEGLLNSCSLSQDVGDQPPERPTTPMPVKQRKPSSPLSSPPLRVEPVRAKGQPLVGKSVLANTGASPAMFYGGSASSASKGKQKATSPILNVDGDGDVEMPDAPPVEADDASLASPAETVPIRPATMIFTLDSLGSKHGAAINNLGRYLQLEAADKRSLPLEESTRADGHKALVPTQPNFCDCGLYLLFFVRQFFTDPEGFRERMTGPAAERKSAWKEKDASNMREQYASQIDALAEEWQKTRPEKPKPAPAEAGKSEAPEAKAATTATAAAAAAADSDSDDEIVVMGESVPPPKAKAPPKARPRKPAGAAAKRKGKGKAEAEEELEVVEGKTVGKAERVR